MAIDHNHNFHISLLFTSNPEARASGFEVNNREIYSEISCSIYLNTLFIEIYIMEYRVLNTSTLPYLIITLPMPPPIDATMVLTAALKRRKEMTIKKDRNVYL